MEAKYIKLAIFGEFILAEGVFQTKTGSDDSLMKVRFSLRVKI